MSGWIDLNADLGEGEARDAEIMALVSSCNIACGGHTGDAQSMSRALVLAKDAGVAAGAHPSYPDREEFGRRSLDIAAPALRAALSSQVEAIKAEASRLGLVLHHLKPHGALYNDAAVDPVRAGIVADTCKADLPGAILVGSPNSALQAAAAERGLRFVAEGFADRAYREDGQLVPRSEPGAVLTDDAERTAQALSIATGGTVTAVSGQTIALPAQTLCLHGDSPGALGAARAIRAALLQAGLTIRAPE